MSDNPIVSWELGSSDAGKTVEFFKKTFGWDFRFDEEVGFFKTGADPARFSGGGVLTLRRARLPFLTLYIQVDDIQEKIERIKENGGLIVDPPLDTGDEILCLFNEPSGVMFGLIQTK